MTTALLILLTAFVPVFVQTVGTSDPWRLWIGEYSDEPIQVWNRGMRNTVEKSGGRNLRITGATRVVLITPQHTQFRLVLHASGSSTLDGIRIRMRTTERDYTDNTQGGMVLSIDRSGMRIEEGISVLATADSIHWHLGQPLRIAIEHDGQQTRIAVGCTVFGPFSTLLPATQQTLIEPIGGSDALLLLDDVAAEGINN
ncbi:MAG: hypothetical protein N2663_07605 [Chlorobi bacterium]|nr:hypothetical protein [Chlorobiota bacterium]